jgi:hypothetical protein
MDAVVFLALVFTATVTPFEVAFLSTSLNALFFLNRVVDLVFLVVRGSRHRPWYRPVSARCVLYCCYLRPHVCFQDLILNFLSGTFDVRRGMWRVTLAAIAHHYTRKWFWIDFVGSWHLR